MLKINKKDIDILDKVHGKGLEMKEETNKANMLIRSRLKKEDKVKGHTNVRVEDKVHLKLELEDKQWQGRGEGRWER